MKTKTDGKTFDKIMNGVVLIMTYVITALFLYVAWIGAKYLFEDVVHWGIVDTFIVQLSSINITRKIFKIAKKYGKSSEVDDAE